MEYRVIPLKFSTHILSEQGATHRFSKSLLISAFQGFHNLSISLILTKFYDIAIKVTYPVIKFNPNPRLSFQPSLSSGGENAAAGLGQDVNTHATSEVTLVLDDAPQSRAHKVILVPLMFS